MNEITEFLKSCLQRFGDFLDRIRQAYRPLSDMRITVATLALSGAILLGVEAGKDVVRSLVDSANATDFIPRWENAPVFFRWTFFWAACIWTGINAWYWAHLLYKSEPGSVPTQPHWFTWFRRILGVLPIMFAVIAMPLSARHPFEDTWLSILLFCASGGALMWFFISRVTISGKDWRLIKHINRSIDVPTLSFAPKGLVIGDVWFVFATLGFSTAVFILLLIPGVRTDFSWLIGPAALTFGAIGCIIPVTSLLIYTTRQYKLPILLLGLCM